jgi:small subunit ribosomal protein S6e
LNAMAEFKLVIANPKSGKCVQKEVKEENAQGFLGKKIGDVIRGELVDMTGYEFKITGGSDYCGFPMRRDLDGPIRKKILIVSGTGAHPVKKKIRKTKPFQFYPGTRQRKNVCGNTIHEKITQINLLVVKEGSTPLEAPAAPAEGEAPVEAKAEAKKEAKAEAKKEAKVEAPKEEVKKEVPKAEVKEEAKSQEKKVETPVEEKKEETPKADESAKVQQAEPNEAEQSEAKELEAKSETKETPAEVAKEPETKESSEAKE